MHYGAAVSAAREMDGRDVVVVGGGNSAGQAAIHLARFARSVTIVVRRPDLDETMSDYLIREMSFNPRDLRARRGPRSSTAAARAGSSGSSSATSTPARRRRREVGGLFLLLGAEPHCDWIPGAVCRDDRGFVLTGRDIPTDRWVDGDRRPTSRPPCRGSSLPATCAAGR